MTIELTEEQTKIFNKTGKFVVNACAGSGKTFTLSKKLIYLIQKNQAPHKGIATLSFTNTAWKEIKIKLDECDVDIEYPNFIGTFDKFINKYIFYQYYYLLEEFDKRPTLVGKIGFPWKKEEYKGDFDKYFDLVSFNYKGELEKKEYVKLGFKLKKYNKDGGIDKNYKKIEDMKKKIFKEGFVTQDDINYFSLKLLKKYKFISKNIAEKFSTFLIDETQDTNETKLKILSIIINNPSVEEVMFIGDFNQAIYEWNGAKPELFEKLMEKYEVLNLKENWRSSQKICDFTSKLTNTESKAVNIKIKDFQFEPQIIGYEKKNREEELKKIIDNFLKICNNQDIDVNPENIAVLCKGNNLIKNLRGQKKFDYEEVFLKKSNITYDLIYSKFLFENLEIHEAYLKLEPILISLYKRKNMITNQEIKESIDEIGFFQIREECLELLNIMPSTKNITIYNWVKKFKTNLKSSKNKLSRKLLNKIKIGEGNILIEHIFELNKEKNKYTLSTIHKSKGKTFDAVLLILLTKEKSSYKKLVKKFNETKKMMEELKNVYVGITRPQKILMVAVPKNDEKMWFELFFDELFIEDKSQTRLI